MLLGACCELPEGFWLAGTGYRPASRAVFVMLAMRKPSHEARAALIPGGLTRWNPGSSTS